MSRVPENAPDQVGKVADASLVQTALQAQLPPKGFDWARVARVEEIHAHVVATLDDLDPTNGIRRVKTAQGERVVKVPPRFGASRMEILFTHNGELYNTGTTRPTPGGSDPLLVIASAHGKPLTAENLDWPKPAKWRFTQREEAKSPPTETEKQSNRRYEAAQNRRLDALRKLVERANMGKDSGFEVSNEYGWAKPLKLTKEECLPCHQGMKVGDTVGIIAYMYGK